jgi:Fe(3+) dicitrate transport protein
MKCLLLHICLVFVWLSGYTQTDSLLIKKSQKQIDLEEIEIKAPKDNTFGISRLNNVEGTTILAGKKTEAVYVEDLNANLASNNSRQIFSKIAGINIFENDGSGAQIGIGAED